MGTNVAFRRYFVLIAFTELLQRNGGRRDAVS